MRKRTKGIQGGSNERYTTYECYENYEKCITVKNLIMPLQRRGKLDS
jgi:hypothetical protein